MLKKFLIGTFVAVAFMMSASLALASYDFGPTTLKVGSSGDYVKTLQTFVGANADGAFGPMTKAKVMAWQASNGLTADGLFGNLSKAKANEAGSNFPAGCTSSTGFSSITGLACTSAAANTFAPAGCTTASGFSPVTGGACYAVSAGNLPAGCTAGAMFSSTTGVSCTGGTTPGVLTGGAGTIAAVETTTDVETWMVEGQSDVKVLGFKITATDSDAKVSNMKITLTHSVSGSTYLDRYVSDVAVWMNGSKIATVAASEFTKDSSGIYSKSIALADAIVKMGTSNKATFYVTVSGLSNIDTADMSGKWTVKASDFRYQDGTGVIMSYAPDPVIDSLLTVSDINSTGDVKLVITKDSSSPAAGNVKVSDTSSTVVPLLVFKAKNTGADMTFDAMDIDVTSTTNPVAMIGELTLKANGSAIATWTPTSTSTALQHAIFDLDSTYTLAKDTTTVFTVEAKINDIDNFVTGTAVAAYDAATVFEVASTRTALTEEGAATGEIQTFFANGIVASAFTYGTPVVTTNTSGTTTSATYAISFKVTASGASYYVKKSAGLVASANGGATATFADLSATGATLDTNWLVADGDTATFTTTGVIGSAASGFAKIPLYTLLYGTTSGTQATVYTFSPATSFETSSTYFTD